MYYSSCDENGLVAMRVQSIKVMIPKAKRIYSSLIVAELEKLAENYELFGNEQVINTPDISHDDELCETDDEEMEGYTNDIIMNMIEDVLNDDEFGETINDVVMTVIDSVLDTADDMEY